jgi:4-amino-4-deoxy-L-arabinose transferase-like glycosyltransferase
MTGQAFRGPVEPFTRANGTRTHDLQAQHRCRAIWLILAAGVLALVVRLPFVFSGLSVDEGGYAYVAQRWSRGDKLYSGVWLDRPQGLLLTYRALLWINDSGWTIRVGMMISGALVSMFLGVIGLNLSTQRPHGDRTGVAAAFIYAIVGVAPHLEGMTLNGELLASVPATGSIAAILIWRKGRTSSWLLVAGVAAGMAMTMKQSGIDGLAVGLAVVLTTRGARIRCVSGFLAGFAVPIAACIFHGWYLGLSRYWAALAGYQIHAILTGYQIHAMTSPSSNRSARWNELTHYLGGLAIDLAVLVLTACVGFRVLGRCGRIIAATWLMSGIIGINLGGSYWPHYYMQVLPSLSFLAAVAYASFAPPSARTVTAVLLVLPTMLWMISIAVMSPRQRHQTVPYDALAIRDRHIARVIDAQTTSDQRIYVLVSDAPLYFLAQRRASYPYLWGKPIQKIPSAVPLLQTMLESKGRPTLVIMATPLPNTVDPSGRIGLDLATYYHPVSMVDGTLILRANESPATLR